jgi:hypothetical protein
MAFYFPHIRELWLKSHFDCMIKDFDELFPALYQPYINEVLRSIPIMDRTFDMERTERNRRLETDYYRSMYDHLEGRRHEQN